MQTTVIVDCRSNLCYLEFPRCRMAAFAKLPIVFFPCFPGGLWVRPPEQSVTPWGWRIENWRLKSEIDYVKHSGPNASAGIYLLKARAFLWTIHSPKGAKVYRISTLVDNVCILPTSTELLEINPTTASLSLPSVPSFQGLSAFNSNNEMWCKPSRPQRFERENYPAVTCSSGTPPETNMEPETDSFQKESPFPGAHFQVPC